MRKFFTTIRDSLHAIKVALFYENGKLSSGKLMLQFMFFLLVSFWIINFWKTVNPIILSSMENVFYGLLAYVFGTKGVGVARTVVNRNNISGSDNRNIINGNISDEVNNDIIMNQKTNDIDSPD